MSLERLEPYKRDKDGNTCAMRIVILKNEWDITHGATVGMCPECQKEMPFEAILTHFHDCRRRALEAERRKA